MIRMTDKEKEVLLHFLAAIIGCTLEQAISYHSGELTFEKIKKEKQK